MLKGSRLAALRRWIIYGLVTFVLLLLVLVGRIRRQAILRRKDLESIAGVEKQLATLQESNTQIAQTVFDLVSGKLETVKMLSEKYETLQDIRQNYSLDEKRNASAEAVMDAYAKALDQLRKDDSYLEGLEQALDLHKESIMMRLRSRYGREMDGLDYKMLILFFSGLPVKTISFLTGMDPGTVYTRRTRYRQRFEKLDSPDGKLFIDSLGYRK